MTVPKSKQAVVVVPPSNEPPMIVPLMLLLVVRAVYALEILNSEPTTRKQVEDLLGVKSNSVSPRLTEALRLGYVTSEKVQGTGTFWSTTKLGQQLAVSKNVTTRDRQKAGGRHV